jgi:DNA (cytosine-5)-methyltransferase 1
MGTDFDCDGGVLPIAFHATQDPISSQHHSPCLSGGNKTGCASVAVALCEGGHGITECETVQTLQAQGGGKTGQGYHAVRDGMRVRRITEVEAERLQGFPDNYTAIPWNGKPASECPSGHRYKSLGNSMSTNVMRWLGMRIAMVDALDRPATSTVAGAANCIPPTFSVDTPRPF